MTVISTTKDPTRLTLTIVADFDASPDRVWEVWEDPRQLERWWGPPTYPATFTRHDFVVGGESRYFMTGPTGDTPAAGGGSSPSTDRTDSTSPTAWPARTANRCPAPSRCPAR